ncbi:MAG: glycosyltransferase family 2 protein [Anaerolineaceae bacterium]|nr:glycosyltransferase family 2 protein [Anaerolineaceae bacterium]
MDTTPIFLSIIFPVHNEENRLPQALDQTIRFLEQQEYASEIIVVENGSKDRTYEVACSYQDRFEHLIVLKETTRGKGLAVRSGMLKARGQYRMFCDVDLSMPIEEVSKFIPPAVPESVGVIFGSREHPDSVRYDEPAYRHYIGRIFTTLVRLTLLPEFQDTQCGFKCFRADVVEDIFPLQRITSMAFDAELLYIAKIHGYQLRELGIPWYFNSDSRVRIIRDSWRMAKDLFVIRRNRRLGYYQRAA